MNGIEGLLKKQACGIGCSLFFVPTFPTFDRSITLNISVGTAMQYSVNPAALFFSVTAGLLLTVHTCVSAPTGLDSLHWVSVSPGVNYARADSALGEDVFIGFGGWTVKQEWANNWVTQLYAARLHGFGIRHLYSVSGPKDDDYFSREIGTLELARHLLLLIKSSPASQRILVAAHSSGAYVAHALFQDLYDGASIDSTHLTDGNIIYFCLDGGIGTGGVGVELTQAIANRLGHIYGVFALVPVPNLYSPNHAEMVELGGKFGIRSGSLLIDATGCGCTGKWCVHETLINQKPYNQTTFDLKNDYGSINAEHPVATAYLDAITGVPSPPPQPEGFRLEQNYPNPFNPVTTIGFTLACAKTGSTSIDNSPLAIDNRLGSGWVKLAVYDVLGREVSVMINNRREPGAYEVRFDGSNLSGGVYFYRLQVRPSNTAIDGAGESGGGDFIQTKKLVLLK